MKEIIHLKSMWSSKIKRSTELIVPYVTYSDMKGSLNNDNWKFKVLYAFRSAMDIKYEERKKDKKPYMIWTQGPILSFKEGDSIISKDGKKTVQVKYSNIMGWDSSKDKMYEGSVSYDEYKITNGKHTKTDQHTSSQMEFLQLLIYGT